MGIRRLLPLALSMVLAASACAGPPATQADADPSIRLTLANTGAEPLQCRLMFGHWVDRDLGRVEPKAAIGLKISQAPDGALYIMRADGQRRMMIETITCARGQDWMGSFGQVDLAPVRSGRPTEIAASCAAPEGGGRVDCAPVRLTP